MQHGNTISRDPARARRPTDAEVIVMGERMIGRLARRKRRAKIIGCVMHTISSVRRQTASAIDAAAILASVFPDDAWRFTAGAVDIINRDGFGGA